MNGRELRQFLEARRAQLRVVRPTWLNGAAWLAADTRLIGQIRADRSIPDDEADLLIRSYLADVDTVVDAWSGPSAVGRYYSRNLGLVRRPRWPLGLTQLRQTCTQAAGWLLANRFRAP